MHLIQMLSNTVVFFLAISGILNKTKNVLVVLMCIELILLSNNLNFILFASYLDDMIGQIFALFVLTVAASESALGLSILILYYRVRGNIIIDSKPAIKH
jgi:NADH-quinone oxidoreductase subunit K